MEMLEKQPAEAIQAPCRGLLGYTQVVNASLCSADNFQDGGGRCGINKIIVTGSEYERMVTEMCAMGFERDQGLPAEPQASKEQEEQQGEGGDDAPASGEESSLDFLWTLPQFITLRERVQENPSILPQLLQQLGQSNPELLQILSERQEEFIAMLNRPAPPPGVVVPPQPVSGSEQAGPSAGQEQGGTSYINVTAQEKEAIERLKALGFSEKMVVQAYFACEKNENLAANFLLSQGFNDD